VQAFDDGVPAELELVDDGRDLVRVGERTVHEDDRVGRRNDGHAPA